jgi:Ca2+:H+ antiporter
MNEREHLLPHHSEEEHLTFKTSFKNTLCSSRINWLLIFVPIALFFSKSSDSVVFSLNFIAIIPLAKLLGFATEEIALRSGSVIGSVSNSP